MNPVDRSIVKLRVAGFSMVYIVNALGVPQARVRQVLSGQWSKTKAKTPSARTGEICESYRQGNTVKHISTQYGVSTARVYAVLERAGVQLRPRGAKFDDELACRLYEMVREGRTQAEAGEAEGISQARVSQLIRRLRGEI